MKITNILSVLLLSVIITGNTVQANAQAYIKVISNEQNHNLTSNPDGSKSVEEATKDFEKKFNTKINIPTKLPLIVTRSYGLVDFESKLILGFFNDNTKEGVKVFIRPISKKLEKRTGDQVFVLKDKTEVLYRTNFPFAYAIEFQKGGMEYHIGVLKNKTINQQVKPTDLIKIAESMI
jgi:hypothetical protein